MIESVPLIRRRRRSGGAVLLLHTFTGSDVASPVGNADTGQTMNALSGTWGRSSNKGYVSTSSGVYDVLSAELGVRAAWVETILDTVAGSMGVTNRVSNALNFVHGFCDGVDAYIQKIVAGANTTLASGSMSRTGGDVFRFRDTGSLMEILKNGAPIGVSASDAFNAAATQSGLGSFSTNTAARYDNLRAGT